MLAVRLKPEIEKRLSNLVIKTGRTKSYYVQRALEEFLEDEEDYLVALERLRDKKATIPLDEVIKMLGISKSELEN